MIVVAREQLRRLGGTCATYALLFFVASLLLYPTSMYLRVFFTAITTGLCYGLASIVTSYFDRWGWQRVGSLNDWKNILRELFSAQDNRL